MQWLPGYARSSTPPDASYDTSHVNRIHRTPKLAVEVFRHELRNVQPTPPGNVNRL